MKYNTTPLIDLFEKINQSQIMLPDFQRDFVWDRNRQSLLVASLMNGIPMGALLTSKSNNSFSCRKIGLSNYLSSGNANELLLDGQQRVTTLFNVFNDIYGLYHSQLQMPPDEIFRKYVYHELKSRWFLRLNSNFMGLKNLRMNRDLSTSEVNEAITNRKDIKTNNNGYGPQLNLNLLRSFCRSEKLLPLFLLKSNPSFWATVLRRLADDMGDEIVTYDDEKLEELRLIHYPDMLLVDFKSNIDTLVTDMKDNWVFNTQDFLRGIIKTEQFVIYLEDISKVSEAFNYLNRGGLRLSNFDLFCSRFSNLGIRTKTIDFASNYSTIINKDRLGRIINLSDVNVLINSSELEPNYGEFLVHVFSLYHYHQLSPNTIKFDDAVLKSKYSLDQVTNITGQIISNCQDVANKIAAFIYLNFGFKGIDKIPNKLALIPIAWLMVSRDVDLENDAHVNLICAHYYTTVFCLYYDSHQNENCATAAKELISLFDRDAVTVDKYKRMVQEIFANYLKKETLLLQSDDYISKSVELNLFNFYLCREYRGIVDFTTALDRINHASEREIHHIIPLSSSTKIKQSTKELRKEKYHRLNSMLNKTPISKNANRQLSDMAVTNYFTQLSSVFSSIKEGHLIPDAYKTFQLNGVLSSSYNPNDPNHMKLDELYTLRYNDLKSKTEDLILTWLNF